MATDSEARAIHGPWTMGYGFVIHEFDLKFEKKPSRFEILNAAAFIILNYLLSKLLGNIYHYLILL